MIEVIVICDVHKKRTQFIHSRLRTLERSGLNELRSVVDVRYAFVLHTSFETLLPLKELQEQRGLRYEVQTA